MPKPFEFVSETEKSFKWDSLPAGEYRFVKGELVRVEDAELSIVKSAQAAADRFSTALGKLALVAGAS